MSKTIQTLLIPTLNANNFRKAITISVQRKVKGESARNRKKKRRGREHSLDATQTL